MDINEHKTLNKIIETIKDYFGCDNDKQAYEIYFDNFRKKLCPDELYLYNSIKNVTDIFIQYNNLYFSSTDGIVQELCNSQHKSYYKNSVTKLSSKQSEIVDINYYYK